MYCGMNPWIYYLLRTVSGRITSSRRMANWVSCAITTLARTNWYRPRLPIPRLHLGTAVPARLPCLATRERILYTFISKYPFSVRAIVREQKVVVFLMAAAKNVLGWGRCKDTNPCGRCGLLHQLHYSCHSHSFGLNYFLVS